jgi:uncharacterized protein (DUF1778 family)
MTSDIQRAIDELAAFEKLKRSTFPLESIGQIANQMVDVQKLVGPNMRALTSFTEQMERSMAAVRSITNCADLTKSFGCISILSQLSQVPTAFKMLQDQNIRWQSLTASLDSFRMKAPEFTINQFASSALVWDSGVSETFRRVSELGMLTQRPDLFSRLLAPSNALSVFAEHTYSLMRNTSDSRVVKALNASLMLADNQHLANIDALTSFPLDFVDDDISPTRNLTTPFVQQEELLALSDVSNEEDIDLLVSQSPAAQESERARGILNLTMHCNKARCIKEKGLQNIFTPTTKLMEVFADLPWITPQEEETFGKFIDCLYFLVYEGAGTDNLRFHEKHGGPLSDDDCKVVWCVKILRNKWLRHDADRGKESDINKSWDNLNSYFQWLGLSGYPRSASDYRKLHRRLLKEIEDFLAKLLRAI